MAKRVVQLRTRYSLQNTDMVLDVLNWRHLLGLLARWFLCTKDDILATGC
jgi:hypothetical protein